MHTPEHHPNGEPLICPNCVPLSCCSSPHVCRKLKYWLSVMLISKEFHHLARQCLHCSLFPQPLLQSHPLPSLAQEGSVWCHIPVWHQQHVSPCVPLLTESNSVKLTLHNNHSNKSPREAVDAPSLEVFKASQLGWGSEHWSLPTQILQ